MKRLLVRVLVPVVVLGLSSGCTAGDADEATTGSSSTSAQQVTGADDPVPDGSVTVETEFPQGVMSTVVHPIQVVGDHSVLTVDLPFAQDATGYIDMSQTLSGGGVSHNVGGIRLVNLAVGKVWTPGLDGEGYPVATGANHLGMHPGNTERVVVFFGRVGEPEVDVMIPSIGLVEDVPVVEDASGAVSVESLGDFTGELSFPDAVPIEAFTQAYDESGAVSSAGDERTVTLASDVLFATDEYELTAPAVSVVDAAGAAIVEVAGSGRVQVVGHTDDVGSNAYNLDLSQKRAASVAARLSQVLGSDFEIVTEGRGESDPAVPGTTAESRAANRRVEIRFTATSAPEFQTVALPDASVPTSIGHNAVEYTVALDENTYQAVVDHVVRRDGYLIGQITLTWVDGEEGRSFGGDSLGRMDSLQNIPRFFRYLTGWSLRVAGTSGWVYPAQHVAESLDDGEYIWPLADRNAATNIPLGGGLDFVVIWPDLDPSADTITIEAPEAFRITDIPVEES